jgi:hypothetical protein
MRLGRREAHLSPFLVDVVSMLHRSGQEMAALADEMGECSRGGVQGHLSCSYTHKFSPSYQDQLVLFRLPRLEHSPDPAVFNRPRRESSIQPTETIVRSPGA